MKGKGKKSRESSDEESNSCPLMFIDFKSLDHSRTCPRYTSVLNRSEEESVGFEDLDPLQLELETLLVSVIQRQKQLLTEMDSLVNWQDAKVKEKKFSPKASSEISGKRSKPNDERPTKKPTKETNSGSYSSPSTSSSGSSTNSKINKSKSKIVKTQGNEQSDSIVDQTQVLHVRNDLPDRFWAFVDNYCTPVKTENIQFLESLLKNYEDESEYYKLPNLGKHYTLKWNQEDRWENKNDDHERNGNEKKKGLSPSNAALNERRSGKKNKVNKNEAERCSFGTLTQRLVSCLFEENLLSNSTPMDIDIAFDTNGFQLDNKQNPLKGVNFGNTSALEKRIKKELEEHGFIDGEFFSSTGNNNSNELMDNEDDEIYNELIKAQNELKAISAQNETQIRTLLEKARKRRKEDELNKRLNGVENEIIDAYKRILSARQKKRSPTKKEKDMAVKALKEREAILNQLKS